MSSLPVTTKTTPTAAGCGGDDDMQEIAFTKKGCMCSWIPCFSSETSPSLWEPMQLQFSENKEKRWWFRGWMKVREWSEVVAGPRWKTFIRRFNKNRNVNVKQVSLNYDPLSYALNFDEGDGGNGGEDSYVHGYGGFSSRFASIPASAKCSMDLGKDAEVIT